MDWTLTDDQQDTIMFLTGIVLVGVVGGAFIIDAQANGFDVSGGLVTALTTLIVFLLTGDIARKRLQ